MNLGRWTVRVSNTCTKIYYLVVDRIEISRGVVNSRGYRVRLQLCIEQSVLKGNPTNKNTQESFLFLGRDGYEQ